MRTAAFFAFWIFSALASGFMAGTSVYEIVQRYKVGPFNSLKVFCIAVSFALILLVGIGLGAQFGHLVNLNAPPTPPTRPTD